jgi:hypothetical protein
LHAQNAIKPNAISLEKIIEASLNFLDNDFFVKKLIAKNNIEIR